MPDTTGKTETVQYFLERELECPLRLTVTDNSKVMLSFRRGSRISLRLHHMFLSAPEHILKALAGYMRRPSAGHKEQIRQFIKANDHLRRNRSGNTRQIVCQPQGRCYNLEDIRDRLNREFFGGRITAAITWGNHRPKLPRRTVKFGSYNPTANIIRINPLLDRPTIPRYFVEYIVFHEMLHEHIKSDRPGLNRYRRVHSREFKAAERRFPHYNFALKWEQDNLNKFIRT